MTSSVGPLEPQAEPLPSAAVPLPAPARPAAIRAHGPRRPWYRREPWLAVNLASFVPIGVGFALPERTHAPLLGASALLLASSVALLMRQGPFRATEPPTRR